MAVKIGSARSSYGNTTRGDQNGGKEVSTESWYLHSKGWRVFRAKDPAEREKLGKAMEMACANNKIGYSQPDRLALFNQVKTKGYDPSKATEATNCDCSSLVRVCCYYAGIQPNNFITSSEPTELLKTGRFTELTASKYTTKSDYLCRGDILVTKTKGHTVIVITSGSKCEDTVSETVTEKAFKIGERELRNGTEGQDVKDLQTLLIGLGYSCGSWGADGEFGDGTEMAVRNFQRDKGLAVTGIVEYYTFLKLFLPDEEEFNPTATSVSVVSGNCYVRTQPNTSGEKLGVAYKGTSFVYAKETSPDGWLKIVFKNSTGWVSGKYCVLQ